MLLRYGAIPHTVRWSIDFACNSIPPFRRSLGTVARFARPIDLQHAAGGAVVGDRGSAPNSWRYLRE